MDALANNLIRLLTPIHNSKAMIALRSGLLCALPAIVLGSLGLLLFQTPIEALNQAIADVGLVPVLSQMYYCCFLASGLFVAGGIAHSWAKQSNLEPMPSAVIAICCFLILLPPHIPYTDTAGTQINVPGLDYSWLGNKGLWVAIASGMATGAVYSSLLRVLKNRFGSSRQQSVGTADATLFEYLLFSLVPAAIMIVGCVVIFGLASLAKDSPSPAELVLSWLQMPFANLDDSLPSVVVYALCSSLLWFLGLHGPLIAGEQLNAIAIQNTTNNSAAIMSGEVLSAANGAHFVTNQFMNSITMTGLGITFGLALCFTIFAQSRRMKTLGIIGLVFSFFNMNEALLLGSIIYNPLLLVPLILVPLIAALLTYGGFALGLASITATNVIWSMPPVVSGFFSGGVGLAVIQLLVLVISFALYLPFAFAADKQAYIDENGSEVGFASPLQRLFMGRQVPAPVAAGTANPQYGYSQPAQQVPYAAQAQPQPVQQREYGYPQQNAYGQARQPQYGQAQQAPQPYAQPQRPYAQQQQPYAQQPYGEGRQPYGQAQPYAQRTSAQQAGAQQPYAQQTGAQQNRQQPYGYDEYGRPLYAPQNNQRPRYPRQ